MGSIHTFVSMYARTTRRIADAIAILCIVVGLIFGLARDTEKPRHPGQRNDLVSHRTPRQQLGCWLAPSDDRAEDVGSIQAP